MRIAAALALAIAALLADMFTIVMMQSPSQRGRIGTELKRLI